MAARCTRSPASRPGPVTACGGSRSPTWAGGPRSWRTACVELGVVGDRRVGTFMFNNNEHVEAYFAVPAMGAVLHTVNIRLFPEQLTYIVDHAEDHVLIVDAALVAGPGPAAAADEHGAARDRGRPRRGPVVAAGSRRRARCTRTTSCWPVARRRTTGRTWTSAPPPPSATRAARPATPRASSTRTGRSGCTACRSAWPSRSGSPTLRTPSWSCRSSTRWPGGLLYAAFMSGASMLHAGPVPAGRAAGRMIEAERPNVRRRRAVDLERPAALPRRARRRHLVAARGRRRRVGLPAGADDARTRSGTASRSSTPGA